MRGITVKPDLNPARWYYASDAARILEMNLRTFTRYARAGVIDRRFQMVAGKRPRPMYQGKELLKFWRNYLLPM